MVVVVVMVVMAVAAVLVRTVVVLVGVVMLVLSPSFAPSSQLACNHPPSDSGAGGCFPLPLRR